MKLYIRLLAVSIILAASVTWLATGANRGWTKTTVPVNTLDDVTGIEAIQYRKQFVPGLDFVGAALLGAGILAGSSFLFRKPQSKTNS